MQRPPHSLPLFERAFELRVRLSRPFRPVSLSLSPIRRNNVRRSFIVYVSKRYEDPASCDARRALYPPRFEDSDGR